ncbi:hypothetical protein [Burkholderia singularis]|uniref:hypothetical protein n=1 Tax=Burkholderia singularis TaxID=1503053 RepID=UPI00117D7880|nr:hypothetical protein [Burkholderia singularis]
MTEYQIRDSIIQECVNICDELVQAWNQELLASTHGDGREHHMAEAVDRCAERILALKAAGNAVAQTSHRTVLDTDAIIEECAKVCDARYMGNNNREDMEARRCAEAIRAIKTASNSGKGK